MEVLEGVPEQSRFPHDVVMGGKGNGKRLIPLQIPGGGRHCLHGDHRESPEVREAKQSMERKKPNNNDNEGEMIRSKIDLKGLLV